MHKSLPRQSVVGCRIDAGVLEVTLVSILALAEVAGRPHQLWNCFSQHLKLLFRIAQAILHLAVFGVIDHISETVMPSRI